MDPGGLIAALPYDGAATWDHSLKSLKPGGVVVISGATSGADPPAGLNRVFFLQLSVVGSTMGTRDELDRLVRLCVERDVRPVVESAVPMTEARDAFAALAAGDVFGKLVLTR